MKVFNKEINHLSQKKPNPWSGSGFSYALVFMMAMVLMSSCGRLSNGGSLASLFNRAPSSNAQIISKPTVNVNVSVKNKIKNLGFKLAGADLVLKTFDISIEGCDPATHAYYNSTHVISFADTSSSDKFSVPIDAGCYLRLTRLVLDTDGSASGTDSTYVLANDSLNGQSGSRGTFFSSSVGNALPESAGNRTANGGLVFIKATSIPASPVLVPSQAGSGGPSRLVLHVSSDANLWPNGGAPLKGAAVSYSLDSVVASDLVRGKTTAVLGYRPPTLPVEIFLADNVLFPVGSTDGTYDLSLFCTVDINGDKKCGDVIGEDAGLGTSNDFAICTLPGSVPEEDIQTHPASYCLFTTTSTASTALAIRPASGEEFPATAEAKYGVMTLHGLPLVAATGKLDTIPTGPRDQDLWVILYAKTSDGKEGIKYWRLGVRGPPGAPSNLSYPTLLTSYDSGAAVNAPATVDDGGDTVTYSIGAAGLWFLDFTGSLPNGLTLNSQTGVISGTTAAAGAGAVTITATNSVGYTSTVLNLTVNAVAPSGLQYAALTYTVGSLDSFLPSTLASNGGDGPITYSAMTTLPAGLSINSSTGAISGTPTTAVAPAQNYTIRATNASNLYQDLAVSITVNPIAPSNLVYSSPKIYSVGSSVSLAKTSVVNGGAALTYSVSSLPAGLSIDSSSGLISGVPTTATAAADYTVTAAHSSPYGTASTTFVVNIEITAIAPSNLVYGNPNSYAVGSTVSLAKISVVNGGAALTYSVSSLPAGLSIDSSSGLISGTPTTASAAADYTVTAAHTAPNGTASTTFAVNIAITAIAPSNLTYTTPKSYPVGTSISALSPLTISDGGAPLTYSATLPAGLSINSISGIISGTPTTASAAADYTVTASHTAPNGTASTTFAVNIEITAIAPSNLVYSTPQSYAVGSSVSLAKTSVSDGGAPLTYSVSPALPAGLSINSSSGLISGIPTTASAAANYTVTAAHTAPNGTASTTFAVNIEITAIAPSNLTYATPQIYTVGTSISTLSPLTIADGGAPLTYSVSPALPAGLSINSGNGNITGNPTMVTSAADYIVTAAHMMPYGTASTTFTINITVNSGVSAPTLSYASSTGTSGTVNQAMSVTPSTLSANGSAITGCGIKPSTTALPATLTVNATTCVISGTPTAVLSAISYTLQATNAIGVSADATVTLSVSAGVPTLSYASSTGTSGAVNLAMSVTPSTLDNNGASITACGIKPSTMALPATLTVNATTCVISGTPTALLGSTVFTLVATNAAGTSADATVSLSIAAGVPTLSYAASTGTSGTVNQAMSVSPTTLTNNGASITACGIKPSTTPLPVTLSVNATSCVISGTPTAVLSSTSYTLQATNSAGVSADATVSLSVVAGVPTLSYASSTGTSGTVNQVMSVAPSTLDTNGTSITACGIKPSTTALPATLTVNATTCVISGTPTAALSSTVFTLVATNAAGTSADATVSLSIAAGVPTLSYAGATGTSGTAGNAMSVSPTTLTANGASITACGIKPSTTALPVTLTVNATTCVISGTPTAVLTSTLFTLQATNAAGVSADATVTLSVVAGVPTLSYAASTGKTGTVNQAMSVAPSTLTNNGASITACGIKPTTTALPATLTVNATTCVISGTPTALLIATTYTLRATNSVGASADATVSLNVVAGVPTLSYATSTGKTGTAGTAMSVTPSTLVNNGASITACGIKPTTTALPATLTVNATTCVISGTPTALLTATTYTLQATNSAGVSADASVTLNVVAGVPKLSYVGAAGTSGIPNQAMSVSPTTLDNNGANVTACGIKAATTALPATLTVNATTCVISGTPTATLSATLYTLRATNSVGLSADATVTLSVAAAVPTLSYATSTGTTGVVGTAMTVTPSTLSSNGASITACGIKAATTALPAELTVNATTCVISGTPTAVLATTQFTLVATNSVGTSADALVSLTVNDIPPTNLTYTTNPATYFVGSTITTNIPAKSGGDITNYSVDLDLSLIGLALNATTGDITGTIIGSPQAQTTYQITGSNSGGSTTVDLLVTTLNTTTVADIGASIDHQCAVVNGAALCWGNNSAGQLGNGTFIRSDEPVQVVGLSSGVQSVTVGGHHSCALMTTGGVKCWGDNDNGRVGDGTTIIRNTPQDVSGLTSGVTEVSAGGYHTCARTTAGAMKCWGQNDSGQLGNGGTSNSSTPSNVSGASTGVTAISAGAFHTCAIISNVAKCWGYNAFGALGNNTTTSTAQPNPQTVQSITGTPVSISAGDYHSCAYTSSAAWCWGRNANGQLGDGTSVQKLVATQVSGLSTGITGISAGGNHSCALIGPTSLKCWGNNTYGQLGNNSTISSLVPVAVSTLSSGITKFRAASFYTCAVVSGTGKCWGTNSMGQLGSASSLAAIVTPVATTGLSADSYPSISAGYNHTCVVPGSTAPKCWGNNAYGQLGNGTQVTSSSPVLLPPLSGTTKIAAGNRFSCALHSTGAVKCWGINDYGQIGDTTVFDKYVPTSVSGVASATSIATGFAHACAIIGSGASSSVKCWGNNSYGQVGNGASGTLVTTPVAVTSLTGATALALGSYHSCALLTTGAVKCWGLNTSGQLGNTTSTNSSSPVQVSGLTSGVSEISVGSYYTCAALSAGGIKCWGDNFSGGFGDGSRTASLVPVAGSNNVSGVFLYLSLGQSHTCGFYNANGYPFCWGNNYNGQLGNGTDILPLYGPIYSVSGIGVGTVSKMTAGSAHTCAVVSNIVKCWGQNTSGELGNGATLNAFSTVPINISWP